MRLIFTALFLAGCQSVIYHPSAAARFTDGVYTRKVRLQDADASRAAGEKMLTCYSEIKQGKLAGVVCQNALGISLFAAGTDQRGDALTVEKTHPHYSNRHIQRVIDVLTLALFEKPEAPYLRTFNVKKRDDKLVIFNNQQRIAEVFQ